MTTKALLRYEVNDTSDILEIDPVYLPDDAPQEVKSALIRLHGQGRKDIAIIERWLYE